MQFQQNFNRKERKEHRDNNLCCFLFAIFVFFVVNSSLVAACRAGPFAPFLSRQRGATADAKNKCKLLSMNTLRLKPRFPNPARSNPVKPSQTQSNHSVTLTNLDHEHPPCHVQSAIESSSPDACGLLPSCLPPSAFCLVFALFLPLAFPRNRRMMPLA